MARRKTNSNQANSNPKYLIVRADLIDVLSGLKKCTSHIFSNTNQRHILFIIAAYFITMDSPLDSPFLYQNNFILAEEDIISSQPILVLLDMEDEKLKKTLDLELSAVVDEHKEETSNGITPEETNKDKLTEVAKNGKAVASVKGKIKSTRKGNTVTPKRGKSAVSKKEIEIDNANMLKVDVPLVIAIDKASGEDNKETSMEQLKSYLSKILMMDRSDLKQLCKDKGVPIKGGPTMKHKYAFALFGDALMQS